MQCVNYWKHRTMRPDTSWLLEKATAMEVFTIPLKISKKSIACMECFDLDTPLFSVENDFFFFFQEIFNPLEYSEEQSSTGASGSLCELLQSQHYPQGER